MGLEDLVPEDKRDTGQRRSRKKSLKQRDDVVVIGSGEYQKAFDEDKWESVKKVLIEEMGLVPNEVVNNFPAQERFQTLHQAAMLEKKETTLEELGKTPNPCDICGTEMGDDGGVDILHLNICTSHPAGQIAEKLNEN